MPTQLWLCNINEMQCEKRTHLCTLKAFPKYNGISPIFMPCVVRYPAMIGRRILRPGTTAITIATVAQTSSNNR